MQPASEHHIPDGLLASITLLSEKPRHGVTSWESALQSGINEANSTAAIGLRFRCWEIASGTVVAPNKTLGTCRVGSTPSHSQYASAFGSVAAMTAQFFSGLGPINNTFGSGSAVSQVMAQSPGVQDAINGYNIFGKTSGNYSFGLSGAFAAGNNIVAQFVGGYRSEERRVGKECLE